MSQPLGFNNTYALGMKEAEAERLGIRRISDLRAHPELRFGFSNEFMDRADGWPALRDRYQLPQGEVRGLDHDLAYRGLESGAIQVTVERAGRFAQAARAALAPFPDSPARRVLADVADYAVSRVS